jgi:hypothetical protein
MTPGSPRIKPFDIEWDYREDPDEADGDAVELTESKAGGTCYFSDTVGKNETLLLQLRQRPAGFNFGGYTAVVVSRRRRDPRGPLGLARVSAGLSA